MKNYTRPIIYFVFALLLTLNACGLNTEKLEEHNRQALEEKKEAVMEQMEIRLRHKYDKEFDVYDLGKGSGAAWFSYCYHPAKAICLSDDDSVEFKVEIETDGKKHGGFKDNYYGYLYGEKVKESLEKQVEGYPLTDIDIAYEPIEEIVREESDLRKNLRIYGEYHVKTPEEIDTLCEMVDELNRQGYLHRVAIYDDRTERPHAMVEYLSSSKEIREFFKG